jgi:hypothetical protein
VIELLGRPGYPELRAALLAGHRGVAPLPVAHERPHRHLHGAAGGVAIY